MIRSQIHIRRRHSVMLAWTLLLGLSLSTLAGEVHKLVQSDDLAALETLLSAQSDGSMVNDTVGTGVTPLHLAAALNRKAAAEVLIAHGAAIDSKTDSGFTPLHWAANRDSVDIAELLIQKGASINATTAGGITPLHWAAGRNATGVLKLLILAGADTAVKTTKGFTPLHWAVMKESGAAAELLAYKVTSDPSYPVEETTEAPAITMNDEWLSDAPSREPPPDRESFKSSAMASADDEPMAPSSLSATESDETAEAVSAHEEEDEPAPELTLFTPTVISPEVGQDCSLWIAPSDAIAFKWLGTSGVWMAKFEITNRQYRRFNPGHSSLFHETFTLDNDNQPVVRVSWNDANRFCQWLTTNDTIQIPEGFVIRLPSEAEWVAAAKSGSDRDYPWGNALPPTWGNLPDETSRLQLQDWEGFSGYTDGSIVSCDVESSGANDIGIFGLAGNVWEWCGDSLPDGKYRVRKGGSWDFDRDNSFRIDYRGFDLPDVKDVTIGFRVVLARADSAN